MKKLDTDISELLKIMLEEERKMQERSNRQKAVIDRKRREIAARHTLLRRQNEEVERLKALLSKYEKPTKDSGNSRTPLSRKE